MSLRRPLVVGASGLEEMLQLSDALENIQSNDASATSITTTTLADVVGSSFALQAGCVYVVQYAGVLTVTGLAATVGFGLAFTGTASSVTAATNIGGATAGLTGLLTATLSGLLALNAVVPFWITGRIRCTTAGTLTLQGQRSAGATVTINGEWGQLSRV